MKSTAPPTRLLALAAAALMALAGCKPDSEPQRRPPASPVVGPTDGPLHAGPLDAPDASAEADTSVAAGLDVGDATSVSPEEARLARLREAPSPEAAEAATVATAAARRLHRKLDVRASVAEYERALAAWPGSPEANYGLAGALALLGDAEGAIARLSDLASLETEASVARLSAARLDPDFDGLAGSDAFRRLTGYLPVTVSWASAGVDRNAALARIAALREARIPATLGTVWPDAVEGTVVLYRADVEGARALAEQAREALGAASSREHAQLEGDRPVVAVLAPASAEAAGPGEGGAPSLQAFVGPRLRARVEGAIEELQLKGTGFFTWERVEDAGKRVKRTGRYMLHEDGRLHIDFRQTTEIPGDDPLSPDVSVEQGRRSTHTVAGAAGGLTVDGVVFEVVP